jgi:hypothetical protein
MARKVRQMIGAARAAMTGDPDKFPGTNRSVDLYGSARPQRGVSGDCTPPCEMKEHVIPNAAAVEFLSAAQVVSSPPPKIRRGGGFVLASPPT